MPTPCGFLFVNAMARVQFELPSRFAFATEFPLYICHMNQGRHLDSVQMLTFVMEARQRCLTWLGFPDSLDNNGLMVAVGDLVVQYVSEAFYGETMCVRMTPGDQSKHGFDLVYRMEDAATGRVVSAGKVGSVFVDRGTRRAAPMPEDFRHALANA